LLRKRTFRKFFVFFVIAILIIAIGHIILYVNDNPADIMVYFDIASPVINALAAAALFWAAYKSRKVSRRLGLAWLMLALSQLTFTLGDIVWAILELGLNTVPYPSIADGLYLLTYPFFFAGAILMSRHDRTLPEHFKHFLDFAVVLSASALGFWRYLLDPILNAGITASFAEQVLTIAYPTGDLILFAALVWVINYNPRLLRKPAVILLMTAAATTIASDVLFSYQSIHEIYAPAGLVDMGWIISYVLMGFAGIYQGLSTEKQYTVDEFSSRDRISQSVLETAFTYFPYIWVVFAYLLLPLTSDEPLHSETKSLYVGVGITISLVIIRQFVALYENRKLASDLQDALDQVQQQTQMLEKTNRDLESEIEQRSRVEKQLIFDALHDPLTKLPNRALFADLLEHKIRDSKEHPDHVFSVLFMDIDQFKVINDSLGHTIGDQLLVIIAKRLENCLRANDTVARLGGDEFVFLIQNTASENAVDFIVKRIREEIQKVIFLGQHPFYITTSIGVVWNLRGYDTPGNVLRDADLAKIGRASCRERV
jgi:diguanylate cyclase (GGDEF)-like protein